MHPAHPILISVLLLCNGCLPATRGSSSAAVQDTVPDTLVTVSPEPIDLTLPDTCFPSVGSVTFDITVFDTLHHPDLENFDDPYLPSAGKDVLTFRGNHYRNGRFGGHVSGQPTRIVTNWVFKTDYDKRETNVGQWGGGTGWTGQPLLSDSMVICSSLCSKVYCIDYETGKALRPSIDVHNPIKGTAMLDPADHNRLYVGQGAAAEKPWGCLTIDLAKGKIIHFFGEDRRAWRGWGAYDSSPLRAAQFVFRPAENGTLYKWYVQNDTILLHSTLRYKVRGIAPGMEASMVIYRNYGFTADNRGNILCTNLNTMRPVWWYDNHDDTDASLVLEEEDGIPYLYSGCEVDKQGDKGFCYLVKLNALTGEKVWENAIACRKVPRGEKVTEGGMFATPLPGEGNCSDLLFVCCITNTPAHHGDFMAIDKQTGTTRYAVHLDYYPWMSPVGFLNENNEQFVVAGDSQGRLYLIKGDTGEILFKSVLGDNFESSPAVRDNCFVVGSRGLNIYKFSVE